MALRKQNLIEQREAHQRRLDELLLQAANLGYSTPPHINVEIEDIEQKILQLDASINALETFDELHHTQPHDWVDRRSLEPRLHIMIATVQATVAEVSNVKKFVTEALTEQNRKLFRAGIIALLILALFFALVVWLVNR